MTATDLHAEALALIAERRRLVAALMGAGDWKVTTTTFDDYQFGICRDHRIGPLGLNCRSSATHAAAVCAAVNDYGPLLDLAEHAFKMHAPDEDGYCLGRHYRYEGARRWRDCPDAAAALRSLGLEINDDRRA